MSIEFRIRGVQQDVNADQTIRIRDITLNSVSYNIYQDNTETVNQFVIALYGSNVLENLRGEINGIGLGVEFGYLMTNNKWLYSLNNGPEAFSYTNATIYDEMMFRYYISLTTTLDPTNLDGSKVLWHLEYSLNNGATWGTIYIDSLING